LSVGAPRAILKEDQAPVHRRQQGLKLYQLVPSLHRKHAHVLYDCIAHSFIGCHQSALSLQLLQRRLLVIDRLVNPARSLPRCTRSLFVEPVKASGSSGPTFSGETRNSAAPFCTLCHSLRKCNSVTVEINLVSGVQCHRCSSAPRTGNFSATRI
jgi:hypothetical protein